MAANKNEEAKNASERTVPASAKVHHVLRAHNGHEWKGATPEKRRSIKLTRVKRE